MSRFDTKLEDCGSLRMAKCQNKIFPAQYLFHIKIKTTVKPQIVPHRNSAHDF